MPALSRSFEQVADRGHRCIPRADSPALPRWEVADVLLRFGAAFIERFQPPGLVRRVMQALVACRTSALGGHLERCGHCGHEQPAYNSCGNRHCPKCGSLAKARWLEKRRSELLPVGYFHVVFTLPHELHPLIRANIRVMLRLLFQAAAMTLLDFARSRWDARLGILAVLHTWDQRLLEHFHLHCLIPAGALSADGMRWIPTGKNFLFPVRALSRAFRARFLRLLDRARRRGDLSFPGDLAALAESAGFRKLRATLLGKQWVVYAKAPLRRPEWVLDYLARYTHRVAVGNHRLVSLDENRVRFRYRDRRQGGMNKTLTLQAEEFIRRFLLHVLPPGLTRVRYFGFLANRNRRRCLQDIRCLIGARAPATQAPHGARELLMQLTGRDPCRCPACGSSSLRPAGPLPRPPPTDPFSWDSS
jgi:hypothetical protein